MNNILEILDLSYISGIEIGHILQIGNNKPIEVFDIKGNKLLVGPPSHHPRQEIDIECNTSNGRVGTYIVFRGSLVRIEEIKPNGFRVSRKRRL